jgi:hypothetical protein
MKCEGHALPQQCSGGRNSANNQESKTVERRVPALERQPARGTFDREMEVLRRQEKMSYSKGK